MVIVKLIGLLDVASMWSVKLVRMSSNRIIVKSIKFKQQNYNTYDLLVMPKNCYNFSYNLLTKLINQVYQLLILC